MNSFDLRRLRGVAPYVVAVLLLIFAAQLLHVARVYSANWDEAHHLYDGYNIWTRHDYRLNAEVPPLVKLTAALPLLPKHPAVPAHQGSSQAQNAFLDGRVFVFSNGGDRLLLPARLACMVFTLFTAWLIYRAGRRMFGSLAALIALALFVFDPNVLAHGTLVSTDLASACFIFAAVYAFYRFAPLAYDRLQWRQTAGRLAVVGVLTGLAMVAKFTGILLAPMLLLLAVAEGWRAHRVRASRKTADATTALPIEQGSVREQAAASGWQVAGRMLFASVAALLCAWCVIWVFYGFRYSPAPDGLALSPRLGPYLASLPNKRNGVELAMLARFHVLPEAYIWGLANTKHTEWEYTSFFFGRMYRHGPWLYFPAAFLIKSTLPLLLLLAAAPLVWWRSRGRGSRELLFLLLPVCVYFAVISSSHFDIGARHLMPIYPFLYVLAGAVAAMAMRQGRVWAAAVCVLLAWQMVTSVRVAPAYMAYGNEAWGGPLAVRRYLSDANVDWGQQLKAVKLYLDENHITNCWFAYFPDGAVQPQDYGVHCRRLPTPSGLWWLKLPMEVPPVIDGTVLISESDLEGVESGDGPLNPYDSFRGLKPNAILQDGVYVYQGRFAVPLAAAWVAVRRSGELAAARQTALAMQTAQEAVQLAPNSARTQQNLAGLLAAQQDWPGALAHYQAALQAMNANRPELEEDDLGAGLRKGLANAQQHVAAMQQTVLKTSPQ